VFGIVPKLIMLDRHGEVFTIYDTHDNFGWETVGAVSIAMPSEIYIGLAVTSHNTGADAWGLFDDVTLRPVAFAGPLPVP
jgi:hypothetical protein